MRSMSGLWLAASITFVCACDKTPIVVVEPAQPDAPSPVVATLEVAKVPESSRWVDLELGGSEQEPFGCAVERNGSLWCWDHDPALQRGMRSSPPLEPGYERHRAPPSRVAEIGDAIAVGVGKDDLCVIRRDGDVDCLAGLGKWSTVEGIDDAVEIMVTEKGGCAIEKDAELRCWDPGRPADLVRDNVSTARITKEGIAWVLQLDGALAHQFASSAWARVPGAIDFAYDSAEHMLWLLDADGQIRRSRTRSSTGSTKPKWEDVERVEGAVQIELVHGHVCVRSKSGRALCRGLNSYGQLGDGSTTSRDFFAPLSVEGVVALAVGAMQTCVATERDIACAGLDVAAPEVALAQHTLPNLTATSLAAHGVTTCATNDAGKLLCWGSSSLGVEQAATPTVVGDAVADLRGMRVRKDEITWVDASGVLRGVQWVAAPTPHVEPIADLNSRNSIEQLAAADEVACTIQVGPQVGPNAKELYCGFGQLRKISGPTFVAVNAKNICAIDRHRHVQCISVGGHNYVYYDEYERFSKIPRVEQAVEVAMADHATCVRVDGGHVSCWVPSGSAREGKLSDVTALVASDEHFCSLDGSGAVRCWMVGATSLGEVESPTIGELVEIVAGDQHFCARDRAGKVTCWGDESHGQLGRIPGTVSLGVTRLALPEDPI